MSHLFGRDHTGLLAQLSWTSLLLVFDFDGTLAPIVEDRGRAAMRPGTAALLAEVARRYPTAVLSGRAQADVDQRVAGLGVAHVIGNHGIEPGAAADLRVFEAVVAQALVLLEQELAGLQGVELEDKRYSLAVHYRRARAKPAARRAIDEAVAALPLDLRVIPGTLVVNVVPAGAPHKGEAVLRLRELERADTVLYVGDDVTDEDVFAIDQPGRVVPIRVGALATSAATYHLRDQREIDRLLRALVNLR